MFFLSTVVFAQELAVEQVLTNISQYEKESDDKLMEKIDKSLGKLFENEKSNIDPACLYAQLKWATVLFLKEEFEMPDNTEEFLEAFSKKYKRALKYDEDQAFRYKILSDLYKVKSKLVVLGSASYAESKFEEAFSFYNTATTLNDIERVYPRIPAVDTSTLYTTAVIASLAGNEEDAITLFEKVTALEYGREDAYDQLINLYRKNDFNVKARKLEIKKSKLFPKDEK